MNASQIPISPSILAVNSSDPLTGKERNTEGVNEAISGTQRVQTLARYITPGNAASG
jgi:hypothetical protein